MRCHLSSACRSLLMCLLVLLKGKFLCLFLVLVLFRVLVLWSWYFAGPCTLAWYFCRGRDLGGLLRRKVGRGTCKVPPRRSRGGTLQVPRPTFREVVRLDHAQGTSCTSYHKNFPTGKLGRQPPKYKDLQRSSGSLRIQIRNYVIFWTRGILNSSIVDRTNTTLTSVRFHTVVSMASSAYPRRERTAPSLMSGG